MKIIYVYLHKMYDFCGGLSTWLQNLHILLRKYWQNGTIKKGGIVIDQDFNLSDITKRAIVKNLLNNNLENVLNKASKS